MGDTQVTLCIRLEVQANVVPMLFTCPSRCAAFALVRSPKSACRAWVNGSMCLLRVAGVPGERPSRITARPTLPSPRSFAICNTSGVRRSSSFLVWRYVRIRKRTSRIVDASRCCGPAPTGRCERSASKGHGLAVGRSVTRSKRAGPKTRARQVIRVVLPRAFSARRRSAPPSSVSTPTRNGTLHRLKMEQWPGGEP
jgi:hypothetical protein